MKAWCYLLSVVPLVVGCAHRTVIVEREGPPAATGQTTEADETADTDESPPDAQTETPPPAPGPEYFWVKGHYSWNGKWQWNGGHWIAREGSHTWVEGHWDHRGHRYFWVRGHWAN